MNSSVSVLKKALAPVVDAVGDDHIERLGASNAIAAAEIVAAARGNHGVELRPEANEWIARNADRVDHHLPARAAQAVERVSIDSELKALWDEAGDTARSEAVANLLERLRPA